jgi:hypothetical protein
LYHQAAFLDPFDAASPEGSEAGIAQAHGMAAQLRYRATSRRRSGASSNGIVYRGTLHSFAAARHQLKQLPPQQRA